MDPWVFHLGLIDNHLEMIMFRNSQSEQLIVQPQKSMQTRAGCFLVYITLLCFANAFLSPGLKSTLAQGLPAGLGICGYQRAIPQRVNQRPVPQPNAATTVSSTDMQREESRIGVDDLLDINVFEAPEMDRTVRVSGNGEISLQLLGTVRAVGLTPRELELVLQELLRRTYMKDPHVGVFIRELQSHPISVVGAVKMPGVFRFGAARAFWR